MEGIHKFYVVDADKNFNVINYLNIKDLANINLFAKWNKLIC